jgi:TonB family protein
MGGVMRYRPGPNSQFFGHSRATVERPVARSLSLSLGSHVAAAAILVFMANGRSSPVLDIQNTNARVPLAFVPISTSDDGGGPPGTPGDRNLAPARSLERHGLDRVTIPTAAPPVVEALQRPDPPPEALQNIVVPVQPFSSGLQNLDGMLRPQPLGDPTSLGPGSRPGTGDGPGTGPGGTGRWAGPGSGDGPPGFGRVSSPRLIRKVDPEYTSGAMQAKLQGTVFLEAVVQADGTVGDVRIIRSLDSTFGLDQNAIKAVRQWRFEPGSQAGKPVPVIVSVELTFTLR